MHALIPEKNSRTDDEFDVISSSLTRSPIEVTVASEEQTIRIAAGTSVIEPST